MLEMKGLENVTALNSVPTDTLLTEKVNGKAAAVPEDALQMVRSPKSKRKLHKRMYQAQL